MRALLTPVLFLPFLLSAQSLVSTAPQQRTALLEDFTGVNCGWCPQGHAVAAGIEAQHPDEVVVVGVHAGGFAVPSAGQPDFRTTEGTAIDAHFTIGGYPAGVINRRLFNGQDDLGRGLWEGAVNEVLGLSSPVNVGVMSSFDAVSRDLTVTVELYYTASSPGGDDYISVLIKEDHLIGWQTDYTNGNNPNYDHTHVLRGYVTSTWGDVVTTTTAGTTVVRTYTFNVPAAWNIANCEVVAFASEYQSEVYQVREVPADGGTTLLIGMLTGTTETFLAGSNGAQSVSTTTLTNMLGASEDYTVTLTSTDAPAGWSAEFVVGGTAYPTSTTLTLADGASEVIDVHITAGPEAAIAHYTLTVASTSEPMAPVLVRKYAVISGVTDLVMTNPQAEPWQPIYMDGLTLAGNNAFAATSRKELIAFGQASALTDVNNIYANISWTFPSITDDLVAVLVPFLDGGGNLMINGQDIGWDQSGDANAYGTPVTQAFYTNYMKATYVADGTTANSQVNFVDADLVFGALPTSAINNVFNGNNYPEEITPIAPAEAIFTYNNVNKKGGLRVQTSNYKLVYMGVGPEQFTDAATALQTIKLSHDWFYGIVGVDELDVAFASLLGQPYPVPTTGLLTLPVSGLEQAAVLRVVDATGRTVQELVVPAHATQVNLDLAAHGNGMYRLVLLGGSRPVTRTVQVQR
ncbi:MAG: Omp28-related outer membrane protein [Flavobacteriales bacterium]|nr:Omp28-related outer membrane protein [Flavobacteriales bacterium]